MRFHFGSRVQTWLHSFVLQVLIAGGGGVPCPNAMTPASRTSYLIDVTPGADHSIRKEIMACRRVVRLLSCRA